MAIKRTITSRIYVLDTADTRHQLTATSAADLAHQVREITPNKKAVSMARTAWGDDEADLRAGGVRLVSVGVTVREIWLTLPPLKGQSEVDTTTPEVTYDNAFDRENPPEPAEQLQGRQRATVLTANTQRQQEPEQQEQALQQKLLDDSENH